MEKIFIQSEIISNHELKLVRVCFNIKRNFVTGIIAGDLHSLTRQVMLKSEMIHVLTDEDKSVYINPSAVSAIRELRDDAAELILQKTEE